MKRWITRPCRLRTVLPNGRRAITAWLLACSLALMAACGPGSSIRADKAEFHYKLAANFFYDDNPQSALKELYAALQWDPNHAHAHHLLGFIYFGRHDEQRALAHLQEAVRLNPEYDEAIANLGNLYLAMEQWPAAIPLFEQLLERPLYKTPYLAWNNLGWARFNLGDMSPARRHFDMAVFLNPKFCLGYNNLGRVDAKEGKTRLALEHFHKALDLCPSYAEPHYFLGRIYAALEAGDRARDHYQSCYDIAPESPYGRRCGDAL